MPSPKISHFKALSFDCYGTLIDWETGIYEGLAPMIEKAQASLSRHEALQAFNRLEADLQKEHPEMLYSTVLATAYSRLQAQLSSTSTSDLNISQDPLGLSPESIAFGESIRNWKPFPDTVDALLRLSKHYRLIILSNVDQASFDYTRKHLEHGFQFDKILTAQEIGSYKPALKNFEYMIEVMGKEFGIKREEILVTAQSLFHDHAPANHLGLASAWIARDGGSVGVDVGAKYDFKFQTLADMADAVEG